MPTNRRRVDRQPVAKLTAYQLATLLDQEPPEPDDADKWWSIVEAGADEPTMAWHERSLARLWAGHRDALMAMWLPTNPGKRPSCWWAYDAPRAPSGSLARATGNLARRHAVRAP